MAEARSSSVSPTGAGKAYLDRAQLSPRTDHDDTQAGNDSAPSERRSDSCRCRIEHVGARQRNLIRLEPLWDSRRSRPGTTTCFARSRIGQG